MSKKKLKKVISQQLNVLNEQVEKIRNTGIDSEEENNWDNDDYTGSNDIPLNNPYPSSQQKPFLEKYWKELLLGSAFLTAFYYYIANQEE